MLQMNEDHERLFDELASKLEAINSDDRWAWLADLADIPTSVRDNLHKLLKFGFPSAPGNLVPPSILGDYQLLEEIGRGGMGIVYRARQNSLERDVAVKLMLAGESASAEDVRRFRREARAVAELNHPNIIEIYEVAEESGHNYFSMKLIDGESLASLLSRGPLGPTRVAELVGEVADALQHAHDCGIVHRDIKPSNVLLDAAGKPQITDFGLARRIDAGHTLTGTGQILGTPSYMSPEQARGKQDIDVQTDIYALGAVAYELLTGRAAFRGENAFDTLQQVAEMEPVSPRSLNPKVPKDLETITLKCLQKSRNARYESARDLGRDMRNYLEGRPIQARRLSRFARAWRWVRRYPMISALGAALVLTLAGLLILFQQQARDRRALSDALVDTLSRADENEVPEILEQAVSFQSYLRPILEERVANADNGTREKLHLSLALLPLDRSHFEYISGQVPTMSPKQLLLVRRCTPNLKHQFEADLWNLAERTSDEAGPSLNAISVLAGVGVQDDLRWDPLVEPLAEKLITAIQNSPSDASTWRSLFAPISSRLCPVLAAVAANPNGEESRRRVAFDLLLEYSGVEPLSVELLREELSKIVSIEATEAEKEGLAVRQALAAIKLLSNGEVIALDILRHSSDLRARTYFIELAFRRGLPWQIQFQRLDSLSGTKDPFICAALIQSLGNYRDQLSKPDIELIVAKVAELHRSHPEPCVHSSASWLLRHWGREATVRQQNQALSVDESVVARNFSARSDPQRKWYVNGEGHTMVVISARDFMMGSDSLTDPNRTEGEFRYERKLRRRFAIAAEEVTRVQYERFLQQATPSLSRAYWRGMADEFCKTDDSAATIITWYEAALYCNWLSMKEGIPSDEWCYGERTRDTTKKLDGLVIKPYFWQLSGYRLPTESEWEYACRAGTKTSRFFGSSIDLLPLYARFRLNKRQTWPVGQLRPNGFGLFDLYGNAMEWCYDPADWTEHRLATIDGPNPSIDDTFEETFTGIQTRVMRGGAFDHEPNRLRSAHRSYLRTDVNDQNLGFRVARSMVFELQP